MVKTHNHVFMIIGSRNSCIRRVKFHLTPLPSFPIWLTYGVGGGEELPVSELNGPGSKSQFCHFIAVWL